MAITNKEILDEIEFLKKKMPNGEFALLKKSVEDLSDGQETLKSSIRELKVQLLDPDNGVVVRVNRNSEFSVTLNNNYDQDITNPSIHSGVPSGCADGRDFMRGNF